MPERTIRIMQCRGAGLPAAQRGALILVTLLILLVVTVLGMSSVDSSGLEMQMSSNNRLQQQTFEAAEYTLSWVENNLAQTGYFSIANLTNDVAGVAGEGLCGAVCFSSACSNGYCFSGSYDPGDVWSDCALTVPATELHADPLLWADGSGKYQTLVIPNVEVTAKYFVEFYCYTAKNPALPLSDVGNQAPMYRITAFVQDAGGRSRSMLRSTVLQN